MTWSRGMNRMSGILILSYRLKEVTNSYVLHCSELQRIVHISSTKCQIEMGFGSKCSILNGQVIHTDNSKLNIANMLHIPLDRVTCRVKRWSFAKYQNSSKVGLNLCFSADSYHQKSNFEHFSLKFTSLAKKKDFKEKRRFAPQNMKLDKIPGPNYSKKICALVSLLSNHRTSLSQLFCLHMYCWEFICTTWICSKTLPL